MNLLNFSSPQCRWVVYMYLSSSKILKNHRPVVRVLHPHTPSKSYCVERCTHRSIRRRRGRPPPPTNLSTRWSPRRLWRPRSLQLIAVPASGFLLPPTLFRLLSCLLYSSTELLQYMYKQYIVLSTYSHRLDNECK